MKKILKCVECSIGCELIVDLTKNEENYFQMNCRHSSQYWKDITALRRSEEGFKLPKLTTEVFNRPDCPDWAKYATVDRDGKARFHAEEPIIPIVYEIDGWYSTSNDSFIPGTFDPSDWENSLIKRPSKEELPDWVKVDNIGWHS